MEMWGDDFHILPDEDKLHAISILVEIKGAVGTECIDISPPEHQKYTRLDYSEIRNFGVEFSSDGFR
jgi:hypothetical protein